MQRYTKKKGGFMTIHKREQELSKLLKDAIDLDFNKHLIENFDNQLKEVRAEVRQANRKQNQLRKMYFIRKKKNG